MVATPRNILEDVLINRLSVIDSRVTPKQYLSGVNGTWHGSVGAGVNKKGLPDVGGPLSHTLSVFDVFV